MLKKIAILVLVGLIFTENISYAATRNIVPRATGEGSIGTEAKPWGAVQTNLLDLGVNVLTDTILGYISTLSSNAQNQLNAKAPIASPTFTTQITTPIINLTGGQIAFPATDVPSANANTLDDYEEGTWSPGISFGGGTTGITYAAGNGGQYTKIGNKIMVSCRIYLSSKGTSTGGAHLTGLPFIIKNNVEYYTAANISYSESMTGLTGVVGGYGVINSSYIQLTQSTSTSGANLSDGIFTNASSFMFLCVYETT